MAAAKRKSIAKLCLALGLFVLAGFFRQADRVGAPLPSAAFFLLTNLIYIGLAMGWGFSISRRILHRCDRRWLLLGCAMAVLWLFLRTVKYRFFNDDTVTRYLWYLYYVPQILAPLFSLFAALQLGRREGDTFSLRWYLLFLPAICLIGGVLTNDLHQMAFRAAPGAATLSADYIHGWVYYLAMAWIVVLLLATGAVIYCKCRVSESRRYAWVPLCVFLGGFALCALSFANIYTFHKIPECCCLTFAAFWESCLQVGLLPTNAHYRYFFSESTVAAQVVDEQGVPVYRAKKCAGAHRLSTGRSSARGDSAERGHTPAKRAGAGRARVLGGGYFENQSDSGATCRNQRPAFGGKRADTGGKRAEASARAD